MLLSAHGLDVGIMAFPAGGTLVFFTRQSIDGHAHSKPKRSYPFSNGRSSRGVFAFKLETADYCMRKPCVQIAAGSVW